jgi:two-component system alkaline phosphatase synthesis response regulator PhoP
MKLKTIIIIEDDTDILNLYQTEFEHKGFKVLSAVDGNSGIKMVKKEKPDAVLLDIILPELNGFIVLEVIKKNKNTEKIPVFIISNLSNKEDEEKAAKMGAEAYWVKAALTPKKICERVKEYFI